MEVWQVIALTFTLFVAGLFFRELARRTALALVAAVIAIIGWAIRGLYWLLIGWWVSMLHRRLTGSLW